MFPSASRRRLARVTLVLSLAAAFARADSSSSGNTGSAGNNAGSNANGSAGNTNASASGSSNTASNTNANTEGGQSTPQAAMPQLYASAPRFIAQDDRGRYVTLDQLTGKFVVLEWFDPNNDYTRRDTRAGTARKLAAKFREKGVVWLAVNSTRLSDVSFNHRWAETNKLGYPVLDDGHLILAKQYGVTTAPFYFILDRNGHVAYEGPLDEDDNRALVQQPRDGRRNWIERALGQLTTGQAVDRPLPKVYGDPLNQ